MTEQVKMLKEQAEKAKILYKSNQMTRTEAKSHIEPYIEYFNEKSKEIAKKYNQRAKTINLAGFLR